MRSIYWVLLLPVLHVQVLSSFGGKYFFTYNGLEKCPNPEQYTEQLSTKLRKINRTHYAYATQLNFKYGLDDTISLSFNVAKKGNGGYKENFYFDRFDELCTFGNSVMPHIMSQLAAFIKRDSYCPLPPGQYNGSIELPVKYATSDLPNIPYGDFRMEMILIKKHDDGREEKLYCIRVFMLVTPQ